MSGRIIETNVPIQRPVERNVTLRIQTNGASITDRAFTHEGTEYPQIKVILSQLAVMILGLNGLSDEQIAEKRDTSSGTVADIRNKATNVVRARYGSRDLTSREAAQLLQNRGLFDREFLEKLDEVINSSQNTGANQPEN